MDRLEKQRSRMESLARTREEICGEKAAALGRVARRLEHRIEQLHRLRAEIQRLEGHERSDKIVSYANLYRDAQRYLWYLRVQREAIGLTDHRMLDRFYVIPGPIRG